MKIYKVFFGQINQQCFTVEAGGRTSAAKKGAKLYREYLKGEYEPCAVEEQRQGEQP